jgi:isocitrate dehydrogenase (NAD+)
MFGQACRHSGHDIAGMNVANPTALLISSINMLRTMNLPKFSELISTAIFNVFNEGKVLT